MEENVRLQKFIASSGVASRRKAEELILQGKIKVNGQTVLELGTKVNPKKDVIEYDGKVLKIEDKKIYVLLNKPIGYVTTLDDQFNREKVVDLIGGISERLVPAGRLDMYTSGALILSNDGDFINKITHPKNEIPKTYNVTLKGIITKEEIDEIEKGVKISLEKKDYSSIKNHENIKNKENSKSKENIKNKANQKDIEKEEYLTRPAKVKILKTDEEKNFSRLQITIKEGKNREIRKMCEAVGKKVLALHRVKIGNIDVKDLKLGQWRYLSEKEVEAILNRIK